MQKLTYQETGMVLVRSNDKSRGWKPWSSGYGKRLTFKRSLVRIPVPDTGRAFFTYIVVKLKCLFEKTENKQ